MKANLATICDVDTEGEYGDNRIVSFEVEGATLRICEECDDYYSGTLDVQELGKLITWLQSAKAEMESAK